MAADQLSPRGDAERSLLSPLGRAGGVLCALRAADPRLRADHGGLARPAAPALLQRQHPGNPAVGTGARAASRAGRISAASIRRGFSSTPDRQALLDTVGSRLRADFRA